MGSLQNNASLPVQRLLLSPSCWRMANAVDLPLKKRLPSDLSRRDVSESRRFPKEVKSSKVEFTCRSGPKANILKKRVQAGEMIGELKTYPTTYSQTVYQPTKC